MTQQESFKRRIRTRMVKTGERYGAARRALLEARPQQGRVWASDPETSDASVLAATGRGWNAWCDLLDAWSGRDEGHTAIARYVREDLGVDAWWAQSVTVGYERITGLRLPGQRSDGTFAASKSRTINIDADMLRAFLLDGDERVDLFPGLETELRSRPTTKDVRLAIGPGTALFAIEPRPDGRVKVTVAHERLPTADDVGEWKHYWAEWLESIDAP